MYTYTAKRLSLNEYAIYAECGREVANCSFTNKLAVWTAEGAPLTGAMRELGMEAFPRLTINGATFTARRRLLTNKVLYNLYQTWLEKDGVKAIEVQREKGWTHRIHHDGKLYTFRRLSFWSFSFAVFNEDGRKIATMRETTPFMTFSVQRTYAMDVPEPIDETLLSFAFWLATIMFY